MKKVYKALSVILISCLSLLIVPFHIFADSSTSTAPFVGINIKLTYFDHELTSLYSEDVYLNTQTIKGTLTGKMECTSPSTPTQTAPCDVFTLQSPSGSAVNGISVNLTVNDTVKDKIDTTVYTTMNRLWEVEFILDNVYVGHVTFNDGTNNKTVYVNGSSFSYNYWNSSASFNDSFTIVDYELSASASSVWNFPIESFAIVSSAMEKLNTTSFVKYNQYFLPFFEVKNGDEMFRSYSIMDREYWFIYMINRNEYNLEQITSHLDFINCEPTEYNLLNRMIIENQYMYILKLKVVPLSQGQLAIASKTGTFKYCPIYWGRVDQNYVSTDFALTFGLTNDLLDALIYGTTDSNQSVTDMEDGNSDFQSSANDLVTYENQFNTDMNNALQNINTNFDFNSQFGSKFLASANWVKTQYDRLTGSSPFGTVISFSLLLGLALILVGKVFK